MDKKEKMKGLISLSEERFDRIEKMMEHNQNQMNQMQAMMEQLIKMVGSNNAAIEELRQDVNEIKSTMATKDDINVLSDADQALLELVEKTYRETEKIESKLDHHANMLDVLATRTTHQEAEIKGLKVAK
ncbi:hypothetical protein SCACP_38940 [Sporomusa carbonis]|uniref:hypothetical protein n=1 Tax=Sporomusa carbonis TaxID=3076075 RepID=UPI003A772824